MKKKYEQPEDNNETDNVNDPEATYEAGTEMAFSPPLTEEELRDSMSTEEFKAYWFQCIDDIFKK